jgi:hypothetical protein
MKNHPRNRPDKKYLSIFYFSGLLALFLLSACDFEKTEKFEKPTWFIDIKIPLVQTRYSLDGIVDSVNIFNRDDSLGMELIFEGELPSQAIDDDNLKVDFDGGYLDTDIPATPIPGVDLSTFEIPVSPINMSLPVVSYEAGSNGPYFDNTYVEANPATWSAATFYMPPAVDRTITAETWNFIVNVFNTAVDSILTEALVELNLGFSDIDLASDPQIVESINALVMGDDDINLAQFITSIANQRIPKDLIQAQSGLFTGAVLTNDTLAQHETSPTIGSNISYTDTTLLLGKRLKEKIKINLGFKLDSADVASGETVVIPANDSMLVNLILNLNIPTLDSAEVNILETVLDIPKPDMSFPGNC